MRGGWSLCLIDHFGEGVLVFFVLGGFCFFGFFCFFVFCCVFFTFFKAFCPLSVVFVLISGLGVTLCFKLLLGNLVYYPPFVSFKCLSSVP